MSFYRKWHLLHFGWWNLWTKFVISAFLFISKYDDNMHTLMDFIFLKKKIWYHIKKFAVFVEPAKSHGCQFGEVVKQKLFFSTSFIRMAMWPFWKKLWLLPVVRMTMQWWIPRVIVFGYNDSRRKHDNLWVKIVKLFHISFASLIRFSILNWTQIQTQSYNINMCNSVFNTQRFLYTSRTWIFDTVPFGTTLIVIVRQMTLDNLPFSYAISGKKFIFSMTMQPTCQ